MKTLLTLTAVIAVAGLFSACNKAPQPESGKTAESVSAGSATGSPIERGKYLVENIGGCNDCHTPWKMGEHGPAPDMTKMLSGSPEGMRVPPPFITRPWGWAGSETMTAFAGPWGISYSANLTPDMETGLGKWTEADFLKAMHTGVGSHNRPIMPPMPWQALGHASDDDLKAIFAFLHSIPPIKNKVPDFETISVNQGPGGMGAPPGRGVPPPGMMPPPMPPPAPNR